MARMRVNTQIEHLMGRIEWMKHLQLIYEATEQEHGSKDNLKVDVEDFQSTIETFLIDLPLIEPEEYQKSSNWQGITVREILNTLQLFPRNQIAWDEVISIIIDISTRKKQNRNRKEIGKENFSPEPAVTTPTKKLFQTPNYNEENDSEVLDLAFKTPLLIDINFDKYQSLKFLSLAGNSLNLIPLLPGTIEMLNLSYNHFEHLALLHMPALRFLNISHNSIQNISSVANWPGITELFASNNRIEKVSQIFRLQWLNRLDLAHNEIALFENIAMLSMNYRLKVLNLTGNQVWANENFQHEVMKILPSIFTLNPTNISRCSQYFEQHGELAVTTPKYTPKLSLNTPYIANSPQQSSPSFVLPLTHFEVESKDIIEDLEPIELFVETERIKINEILSVQKFDTPQFRISQKVLEDQTPQMSPVSYRENNTQRARHDFQHGTNPVEGSVPERPRFIKVKGKGMKFGDSVSEIISGPKSNC